MAFIDFVRWEPGSEQIFAWKFPENNLSTFTQLVVSESQEAVLFSKGQVLGKFGPGKHTLNTENLPLLRNLFGIPFGGKNPFTAEVWFVNKLVPLNIDWHTDSMLLHDPDYQTMVPLLASGRYGLKVADAERFLIKLVGTAYRFDARQLTDHFWGALVSKTKSVLLQFMQSQRVGIKSIAAHLDNMSEVLKASMLTFWEDYGFVLAGFYVTTVEVDGTTDVGKRILEAMSRQSAQIIGGYTWQQSQAFDIAGKAVGSVGEGQGGLLGAVLATNMMGNMTGGGLMQSQPSPSNPVNPVQPVNPGGINPQLHGSPAREVYCSNCGKKFANTMRFCPSCGDPYTPCPRCGADNDTAARRCVSCGTPLLSAGQLCPQCQSPIPPGSAFCPGCGKQSMQSEDKCIKCGAQIKNSQFCPQCGAKKS